MWGIFKNHFKKTTFTKMNFWQKKYFQTRKTYTDFCDLALILNIHEFSRPIPFLKFSDISRFYKTVGIQKEDSFSGRSFHLHRDNAPWSLSGPFSWFLFSFFFFKGQLLPEHRSTVTLLLYLVGLTTLGPSISKGFKTCPLFLRLEGQECESGAWTCLDT